MSTSDIAAAPVVRLDETGSTNTEAMARLTAGAAPPFWVTARRQTAGRGRSGRAWASGEGNLMASLAVALDCPPEAAGQLSLVAGLAVVDAVHALAPAHTDARAGRPAIRLKWPNDVMAGDAKLAGLLIETTRLPGVPGLLSVVGIGLNVAVAPALADRRTTCLTELGLRVALEDVFPALALAMANALALWQNGANFAAVRARWLDEGMAAGTPIVVDAGRERLNGTFAGLDEDGALILTDEAGARRRVTYGDVTTCGAVPGPSSE